MFLKTNCSSLKVFGVLNKLKANLGVMCYLHMFRSFLKVLDALIVFKAILFFIFVIEVFLVLRV